MLRSNFKLGLLDYKHWTNILQALLYAGGWEGSNRRLLEPPHYDGVQALALSDSVVYSASRDTSLKRWSLTENCLTHVSVLLILSVSGTSVI